MFKILFWKLYNRLFPATLTETLNFSEGENMTATIFQKTNGRFGLFIPKTGEEVGTYARARDARRGATRRGLVLA